MYYFSAQMIHFFIFTPVTMNLNCDVLYTQPMQALRNNSIQIKFNISKTSKTRFGLVNMTTPILVFHGSMNLKDMLI